MGQELLTVERLVGEHRRQLDARVTRLTGCVAPCTGSTTSSRKDSRRP
jgi:hypothetical protein